METAKIKELVSRMTLEEKASLCSGLDFWHTTIWESTTAFRLFAFQRDVQPHPALTVSW